MIHQLMLQCPVQLLSSLCLLSSSLRPNWLGQGQHWWPTLLLLPQESPAQASCFLWHQPPTACQLVSLSKAPLLSNPPSMCLQKDKHPWREVRAMMWE